MIVRPFFLTSLKNTVLSRNVTITSPNGDTKKVQNLKNSDRICFLSDAERNFQAGVKNNTWGAKNALYSSPRVLLSNWPSTRARKPLDFLSFSYKEAIISYLVGLIEVSVGKPKYLNELEDEIVEGPT